MTEHTPEEVLARFDELTVLETEFENNEIELIKQAEKLNAPLYEKRAEVAQKIPHFWSVVLEQSPAELDNFFQPSDSQVFADCLKTLEVERFEINKPGGSPRSFSIKFGFSENDYFEDSVLEKKFWYRRALDGDGWVGLVSEPVKIHWKKGKDLTNGLTDAAVELWEAKQKIAGAANGEAKTDIQELPEYKHLARKIEFSEEASPSFFGWFGYVSSWRFVTAEENTKAEELEAQRHEKRKKGEKVEEDEADESNVDYQETEIFPQGEEIATILAEDIWPSAIKYYKAAHEADDEDLSELEIEDMDEDDSDQELDIRALVGKGKKSVSASSNASPPPKKQRKE